MSKKFDEIAETIDLDGNLPGSGPVNAQSRFPVEVDERFQFVRQLGSGGMGMVYQAYDEVLQRHVALKFLINTSSATLPMLVSEARAQAKLEHKYLCPIYEVLESGQSVYLEMQYIEGSNLQELSSTLTQEQNLLLIMQCAQALEAAHREGMIHRDFKPLNVMIKASDDGLEPSIVDFGLACSTKVTDKAPRLVSLRFTAPEQLSRQPLPIDRRVDVYSIGATLYYCLLREPPPQLDENNRELPTHKPQWQSLPKDIQLIIQKCMQVDLSDRYANAAQVAEDIQCYLNGEPISVHDGLTYRVVTKVKKHKWLALAIGAAFLITIAAIINIRYEAHLQGLREAALVKFNNQIKELEHDVQLTLLSPRHNITKKRQRWLQEALSIENDLPNIKPVIRSTAQYAIGRIYLVVNDTHKALKHLKEAHAQEPSPMIAFYLAIAYSERYKQEVEKLRTIKDATVRRARLAVASENFKKPALSLLAANLASAPHPAYAEALLAYLKDDWDEVLRIFDADEELPVWFYHDELLKGDIALSKASDLFNQSRPVEEVLAQVQFAQDNYQAASLIAKSDPDVALKPFYADLFRLRTYTQAGLNWDHAPLLALQARYQELSQIDTNNPIFHKTYGEIAHFYGLHLHYTNGDPKVWFEIAEQELLSANQLLKKEDQLWMSLGQLYSSVFSYLTAHNLSAEEATQKAVDAMNKVPSGQRDYYYYNELGTMYRFRGTQLVNQGESDATYTEKAVAAYLEAYERNPEFTGSLVNAASALEDGTSIQHYDERFEALDRGKEFLNLAIQDEPAQFVTQYYLAMFDVESVVLALYHERPTEELLRIAEQQLLVLKNINQSHPYVLDLELRLKQYRAEIRFTQTNTWVEEFDNILQERQLLLAKFPRNAVVMGNYANFAIGIIGIRFFEGLPISEPLSQVKSAIREFPNYQGVNAHLAILEVYEQWHSTQQASSKLTSKYQLDSLIIDELRWIVWIVKVHEATQQGEINIAKQQLRQDMSVVPAFKRLILQWMDKELALLAKAPN